MPSAFSGYETCPKRTSGCTAACLNTAGRGGSGVYLLNTYNLPARPLYNLPALTLHESAPGHALQGSLALEHKDQPEFRQHTYISAYGEGDRGTKDRVPFFERYFLGGVNNLRGYKYRTVGPRDLTSREPLGGGTYWYGTAEYSVPVILLTDQGIATRIEAFAEPDLEKICQDISPNFSPVADHKPYDLSAADGITRHLAPGTRIQSGKYPIVTGLEHDELGHPTGSPKLHMQMTAKRRRKLQKLGESLPVPKVYGPPEGNILLVGWGSTQGPIREAVDRARKADPDNREAQLASARLALDKNDSDLASRLATESVAKFPKDAEFHFLLARAFQGSDRHQMLVSLSEALELNENHVPSYLLLAEHLIDAVRVLGRGRPRLLTPPMFSLHMTIVVPAHLSVAGLRSEFMDFCDHLNFDAIMEPVK